MKTLAILWTSLTLSLVSSVVGVGVGASAAFLGGIAEASEWAQVSLRWFNDRGDAIEAPWKTSFKWIWQGDLNIAAQVTTWVPPHLRIRSVEPIDGAEIQVSDEGVDYVDYKESQGSTELSPELSTESSESLLEDPGQVLIAKMWRPKVTAKVTLEQTTKQGSSNGLQISFQTLSTAFLVHPGCLQHGLSIPLTDSKGFFEKVPFIGVVCSTDAEHLYARIQLPFGATLNASQYELLWRALSVSWELNTGEQVLESFFIPPFPMNIMTSPDAAFVFKLKSGGRRSW